MNSQAHISDLDQAIRVVIKNLEERSEEPISFWETVSTETKISEKCQYFEAKPH
ncbi:MAG: hypothetical protein ACKO3R_08795 [bacterium]